MSPQQLPDELVTEDMEDRARRIKLRRLEIAATLAEWKRATWPPFAVFLSEELGVILDGRKGDRPYQCYDAKTCCMVKSVVWVNDETAQWGRYVFPPINGELFIEAVQEDRITIYAARKLVVFNEVDDSEPASCRATAASEL